jgi:hypothetical protein
VSGHQSDVAVLDEENTSLDRFATLRELGSFANQQAPDGFNRSAACRDLALEVRPPPLTPLPDMEAEVDIA